MVIVTGKLIVQLKNPLKCVECKIVLFTCTYKVQNIFYIH